MKRVLAALAMIVSFMNSPAALAEDRMAMSNIAGLYKAVLYHDETNFYQYAKITLRTVNPEGQVKISANVRVFFGEADSTEYLTYEFDDVPLNILTRQLAIKNGENDISMVGFLRGGSIQGEWFSTLVGKVGRFIAQRDTYPEIENEATLVEPLSGYYRGSLENTNEESNLPERVTFSFVTTQENSDGSPSLHISGNTRFYLGDFGSLEYVEVEFEDIQFNFYNRFLTAKTDEYGLTFKGTVNHDGTFEGVVFSDGLGEVANISLAKPNSDDNT